MIYIITNTNSASTSTEGGTPIFQQINFREEWEDWGKPPGPQQQTMSRQLFLTDSPC